MFRGGRPRIAPPLRHTGQLADSLREGFPGSVGTAGGRRTGPGHGQAEADHPALPRRHVGARRRRSTDLGFVLHGHGSTTRCVPVRQRRACGCSTPRTPSTSIWGSSSPSSEVHPVAVSRRRSADSFGSGTSPRSSTMRAARSIMRIAGPRRCNSASALAARR
jgi:hypothetical protein